MLLFAVGGGYDFEGRGVGRELAGQLLDEAAVSRQTVDIEAALSLIRKYGNHIPVVYRADIDRELYWPFDAVTLQDFIELEI